MQYSGTLIVVKDIEKAKRFYREVLGLQVIADFGANITLTGGISMQTVDTWKEFINKQDSDIVLRHHAGELYFEEDDIDKFMAKISVMKNIDYVHPLKEHAWGQRAVRFYDVDGHIIEVGESITSVVKRFSDRGLSVRDIAVRMDMPVALVQSCLV